MKSSITTYEVEPDAGRSGGDAGDVYKVRCPECGTDVYVGEFAWWSDSCDCGYHWSVTLEAIGTRHDPTHRQD
jgi:hypothetical protein